MCRLSRGRWTQAARDLGQHIVPRFGAIGLLFTVAIIAATWAGAGPLAAALAPLAVLPLLFLVSGLVPWPAHFHMYVEAPQYRPIFNLRSLHDHADQLYEIRCIVDDDYRIRHEASERAFNVGSGDTLFFEFRPGVFHPAHRKPRGRVVVTWEARKSPDDRWFRLGRHRYTPPNT